MKKGYIIRARWTDKVLYSATSDTLYDAITQAVNNKTDLSSANLSGAYLGGANLGSANLSDANLGKHGKLIGKRPILQIGPIGSRRDHLVAVLTNIGVYVRTGCFFGTLDAFRAACIETHGESVHGREYATAITMIEAHADLWGKHDDTQ